MKDEEKNKTNKARGNKVQIKMKRWVSKEVKGHKEEKKREQELDGEKK